MSTFVVTQSAAYHHDVFGPFASEDEARAGRDAHARRHPEEP